MIRLPSSTRLIVHRPPPTTLTVRAGHEIYQIWVSFRRFQPPLSRHQPTVPAQRRWPTLADGPPIRQCRSPG